MKAVVMAGGEGTRLRPLTSNRPKPLVPILNKPCMQHSIELLKRYGIDEIIVTLYYLADEIQGFFGDGSDLGVKLHYTIEDTPLGTAGSVKQAHDILKDDTFIIVSGDALTDINVEKALEYHRQKKSLATLVLQHVENPLEFGVVITDDDGQVRRFLEKPSWGEVFSDTVNTGMYIIEPEILDYMEPNVNYDWSQDIFPTLLREGRPMYGYVMDEYWTDVGSLQQYRQAQYEMLQGRTTLPIEGHHEGKDIYVGENTRIDPSAQITGPVLIGKNCTIKSGAHIGPETVIGDNCLIEEGATLQKAIVWDSNYIGQNTRLNGCTVCFRCTIKNDVNIQEGAVVGDRCHIENGASIRPLIKLWPDKVIEAGSMVTMSLIWGSRWQGSLFNTLGVSGIANVEMTPDFATKLGASYGAFLKKGASVLSSRDATPVCRMIKRGLVAGLVSVGVNILDNQEMPVPITRHSIRANNAVGGIHVRLAPDSPNVALIEIFDKSGINISSNQQRKIESIFYREDFGRTDIDSVGHIDFVPRAIEQYSQDFFRQLNTAAVADRNFRVVVDYAYSPLSGILPQMLGQLGIETIALNAYTDGKKAPRTHADREILIKTLSEIVLTLKADVGVQLAADGERLTLVDETGHVFSGNELLSALALLSVRSMPGSQIALPVTAPNSLANAITANGGEVRWTKTDVRSLMSATLDTKDGAGFAGDAAGGFIFPGFHPAPDALFAFAKTLEMLAIQHSTLSDVRRSLPAMHMCQAIVRCPWESKGKVMRVLTEESAGEHTELVDGIKIYQDDNSWVLVLPDANEPLVHVYAEGPTQDVADELAHRFQLKVTALRG
ncbi:MAG: sugar phosphate nucleotidyltransferase [Capsulimonadaceae bacterium]|nr:sugar phosphate nucleotidyltransferase [Capsulimonadaceae bacterium]